MKKLLTLAIPCFLSVFSGAVNIPAKAKNDNPLISKNGREATVQVKGQLAYTKTIDDKATSAPRTENYLVYFDRDRSIEVLRPLSVIPSSTTKNTEKGVVMSVYVAAGPRQYFLLKEFKSKKLTLAPNIGVKHYLIEDTLSNFKWEITNEKKQLLKYNCTKATTVFRGRKYEAWFTEDVPLRNGPWKFCGLPGLIVKVNDTENVYNFELVSINFDAFDDAILQMPVVYLKDKPIYHRDFIGLYAKKVKDLEIESRASYQVTEYGSSSSKSSIPPLIEKF